MTTVDLTPYWPDAEDWTGFLLVIVPVGPLPVSSAELCRRVRAEIEPDPVLYDLVTVSSAPWVDPEAGLGRDFLNGVVEAAMPGRHFFAPRGVIGVVFAGTDKELIKLAYAKAGRLSTAERVWSFCFGVVAAEETIQSCVRAIYGTVRKYEEQPEIAESERVFLGRLSGLAAPAVAPEPARIVPPPQRLLQPVMYDSAEIVAVDRRSAVQKIGRQARSDADCLDELQRDGRAVGWSTSSSSPTTARCPGRR